MDDLENQDSSNKNDDYLSTDKLEKLDKDNLKKSGLLTDEKLRNIITYLDEVETAERLSLIDQVRFFVFLFRLHLFIDFFFLVKL